MTSNFDPREGEFKEARHEGCKARRDGKLKSANPHMMGCREWGHWNDGYVDEDNWIEGGGVAGFKRDMARKRLKRAGAPVGLADWFSGEAAE